MDYTIDNLTEADRSAVTDMMREFYASDALLSNGSEEIFAADINACTGGSPYAEGYVFKLDGKPVGYGMLAKSYSTEFGKPCIWIEDIYILPEHRHNGLGTRFIRFVADKYGDCVLRLEAESNNKAALAMYGKCGFEILGYTELIRGGCREDHE